MIARYVTPLLAALTVGCLLVIGALYSSGVANAQIAAPQCGPMVDVLKQLKDRYKEAPVAMGVVDDTSIMQLFASGTGSWTIVVTTARGVSCSLQSGESLETYTLPVEGPTS